MSNVKNSYNGIRRIRKGYKLERLNRFVLMRPLRNIAKAITDEYIIESPIFKKWTRKIIFILLFFNLYNNKLYLLNFILPYPKPTHVR